MKRTDIVKDRCNKPCPKCGHTLGRELTNQVADTSILYIRCDQCKEVRIEKLRELSHRIF